MSIVLAAAVLAPAVLIAPAGRPRTGWAVEETPLQVVARKRSAAPIDYGLGPMRPELLLACDKSTKAVEAYFDVGVKPSSWDFALRLDQDPAVQYAGRMRPGRDAAVLQQLEVPPAQARAFVASLVRHDSLVLRFTRSHSRETTFDLRGLDAAIGPLEGACGLEGELAAARATPAAPAAVAPARSAARESRVGNWEVREKTSSLDDKPVVVLAATAKADWSRLVLRCQESTVEAYVVSGSVIDTGNKDSVRVPIAVGDEPFREVEAGVSADRGALFLPDAARLIQSLRGQAAFRVRFQRYRARSPVDAAYDLTGLDRALEAFTKACPID